VAMVRLDRLLVKTPWYVHGGHEDAPADEPSGDIDQPMDAASSADGTGTIAVLPQGVTMEWIFLNGPKYLDLHAATSEDSPPLACADLGTQR
jgi:hypothetical protein